MPNDKQDVTVATLQAVQDARDAIPPGRRGNVRVHANVRSGFVDSVTIRVYDRLRPPHPEGQSS